MSDNKIDLHILKRVLPDKSPHTKRVKLKLGKIRKLVEVHELVSHEEHIGARRAEGFSVGEQPYVSFMDEEDDIEPNVFQRCIEVLDANPDIDAVVTDERHIIGGRVKAPLRVGLPGDGELYSIETARYIHHMVVLRRSSLQPYMSQLQNWPVMCEFTLYGKMILDGCKFMHIDRVGYYWYAHNDRVQIAETPLSPETLSIMKSMYRRDPT